MKVTAKLNNLRTAPRKVRLVADLIRRKNVLDAEKALSFTVKKSAAPLLKLLNSAVANAKSNFQIGSENLYIYKITVDEGPKLKRWRARSRGRAFAIQKKTSHITIILDEIKPGKKVKKIKEEDKKVVKEEKEEKKVQLDRKPRIVPKFEKPTKENQGARKIFRRKAV